ncbi:MAG: DUF2207 domain-containing protein [bacterium]|nr:DUF2207 domain-containing protein [bacterium]
MKRILLLLVIAVLCSFLYGEYERILKYDSKININEDGSMLVREKIRVYADNSQIQRGIYRDFPLNYVDKKNNRYKVDFEIVEILKNGEKEPFFTKSIKDGIRIYIGNKDVFLTPGYYEYEILYRTERQIGFFKDFSELYWNVTGNGWGFQMDTVVCTIVLPEKADVLNSEIAGYTGYVGDKGNDWSAVRDTAENSVTFSSTRTLWANEGLTVAVSFEKSAVKEPDASKKIFYLLKDNADLLVGLIGFSIILVFFILMWKRVGRDPERRTAIPQFDPPAGISPGDARFIKKMVFDNKIIVAEIVNLAVKKHLKIEKEKKNYVVIKEDGKEKLNESDERAKKIIFASSDRVVLEKKNYAEIGAMVSGFQSEMKNRSEGKYFKNNLGESGAGCFFSILLIVLIFLISPLKPVMGIIFSLLYTFLAFGVWAAVSQTKKKMLEAGRRFSFKNGAGLLTLLIFSVILVFVFAAASYFLFFSEAGRIFHKPYVNIAFVALFAMNIIFFNIMRAYTPEGMELLLKIEGFKMYIDSTDEGESGLTRDIEMNQDLFEKYLPYAIALDAESTWVKKFEEALSFKEESGRIAYYPIWYHADNFNVNSFASSFSSSMSSAISTSSQAPGSSSGSGGGGSSGGGGGGGGGGGW